MLGRMFGHEFHALLMFQKFLIADDFAALFGISSRRVSVYARGQRADVGLRACMFIHVCVRVNMQEHLLMND